jgi:hypothetical protein
MANPRDNPHWSQQFDVYFYDIEKKEEVRVTRATRSVRLFLPMGKGWFSSLERWDNKPCIIAP